MPHLAQSLHAILDAADKLGVLDDGLLIAEYTESTDERTSLPIRLLDCEGTEITDGRELDALKRELRRHGWATQSTDAGVNIVALNR